MASKLTLQCKLLSIEVVLVVIWGRAVYFDVTTVNSANYFRNTVFLFKLIHQFL